MQPLRERSEGAFAIGCTRRVICRIGSRHRIDHDFIDAKPGDQPPLVAACDGVSAADGALDDIDDALGDGPGGETIGCGSTTRARVR